MGGSVRLYDPLDTGVDAYTGRWVVTIAPYTPPVGSDGQVQEFDFEIPVEGIPGGFAGFSFSGDAPTDLSGGFVYDSDDPLPWATGSMTRFLNIGGTYTYPPDWSGSDTNAQLFDGEWAGPIDLGFAVTIDPLSDPTWLPPPPVAAYEVVVVAQDGTPFGTLTDPKIGNVSWELNGPGAAEITLATTDADADLMLPGREVQVYYQGGADPIWWGPIVRPQAGLHETTWQCAGLLWYFGHRFMGRADRVNQLTNGDFESSETGWSFTGVTHSVNTDPDFIVEGTKSEKLTGATADHATYMSQTWTHPAGGYPTGDFVTGSVWVWISAADYLGPAIEDFGLVLRRKNAAGQIVDSQFETGRINDDTPRDQWVPLEVGIANVVEDDTIDFLLFPPHGVAYFDLATLTFMESLSFGYPIDDDDVTDIVKTIVHYAQDHNPPGFDHGKSDLDIDVAGEQTGVTRRIAYQFAEHRNILDAILEYVRQGLCDISIEIDATTRTFTVWPSAVAADSRGLGKGVLYGTTLELDVNVADFTYSVDLEQAASNVILLGPGDGPDRPEGGATDTSLLGGAFTMEIVEQAPDNTTVGQLDIRAAERLKVAARPDIVEVTTLPGAGVIGDLAVGDTVPVLIARGWVDIDDTYRVAAISADLLKDQATITLNALP